MENRYNKEYEQYYIYALEQFLIKTYGFSEHDAKVKVMQDFDEVKEDFETKEIKWMRLRKPEWLVKDPFKNFSPTVPTLIKWEIWNTIKN